MSHRRNWFVRMLPIVVMLALSSSAVACGDDGDNISQTTGAENPSPAASEDDSAAPPLPPGFVETVRRSAEPDDFDPVCVEVDATSLAGSYAEYEGTESGVIVITGSGDPTDIAALEDAWNTIDTCVSEGPFSRWSDAPAGSSGWVADLGGGISQHLVLRLDGTGVLIAAASGADSAATAATVVG